MVSYVMPQAMAMQALSKKQPQQTAGLCPPPASIAASCFTSASWMVESNSSTYGKQGRGGEATARGRGQVQGCRAVDNSTMPAQTGQRPDKLPQTPGS